MEAPEMPAVLTIGIRVEHQAIARCELNVVRGLGWCYFSEAAEDAVCGLSRRR
jgi:hypothetical protein